MGFFSNPSEYVFIVMDLVVFSCRLGDYYNVGQSFEEIFFKYPVFFDVPSKLFP